MNSGIISWLTLSHMCYHTLFWMYYDLAFLCGKKTLIKPRKKSRTFIKRWRNITSGVDQRKGLGRNIHRSTWLSARYSKISVNNFLVSPMSITLSDDVTRER